VLNLPGYIETLPLDLTGAKQDFQQQLELNLPLGINAVNQSTVTVEVGITAIEGSLTINNLPVEIIGLGQGLKAEISPQTVNIILNGPLPILDNLSAADITIRIDLTGVGAGSYQKVPEVMITKSNIQVQSIVPGTLNVTVTRQ